MTNAVRIGELSAGNAVLCRDGDGQIGVVFLVDDLRDGLVERPHREHRTRRHGRRAAGRISGQARAADLRVFRPLVAGLEAQGFKFARPLVVLRLGNELELRQRRGVQILERFGVGRHQPTKQSKRVMIRSVWML